METLQRGEQLFPPLTARPRAAEGSPLPSTVTHLGGFHSGRGRGGVAPEKRRQGRRSLGGKEGKVEEKPSPCPSLPLSQPSSPSPLFGRGGIRGLENVSG